ncbi:LIM homeobox transcription factor 1-beta-like [Culicoides brevitarsis]|uniref:LIM homeobox transcription factor 1-beta-like n=1 Tax=Culicoides brevitarsis TaxID=469753 RepID=UPI00307BDDAE
MLDFYPNLRNAGLIPVQIDTQATSLPMMVNKINKGCNEILCQTRKENLEETRNKDTPNEGKRTSLSDCIGQTDVGHIKREKTYELCEGCGLKIEDRFFMRVVDTNWHESCLVCSICNITLINSCYSRNSKLFCKEDYYRLFVKNNCSRCGNQISSNEFVMRVQPHVYHLECFVCCTCNQPLQKGEQFCIRGTQPVCQVDLEKEMYLAHQYGDEDLLIDERLRPTDGRRGPKRPRTILTSAQRRQFKASFEVSPKPCRKIREALAKDTGLSVRVVQVWFQNQRAKMKKIQRKAKNDGDKKGDTNKENKSVKVESPSSEHGHYLMENSFSSSSQPLNPNVPFSPDFNENSNDSIGSSDISDFDGSNFDQLDETTSDTLQNISFSSQHSITCENNNNQFGNISGSVTHIDKLYLMQNSYFSGIEQ